MQLMPKQRYKKIMHKKSAKDHVQYLYDQVVDITIKK